VSALRRPSPYEGLVIVDKLAGWTSHDVVGRMRRLVGSRRVGHAGTLDPMATGVLVVGVERATRLLGHLSLRDKAYTATARLGVATDTDDADGEVVATASTRDLTAAAVRDAVAALTGEIDQVPSAYSAVKVDGVRAYARSRAGERVELPPRRVTVSRLDVLAARRSADGATLDVDLAVVCTSGTYVRALARDVGAALGVGGHLVALRRTRVGPFGLSSARPLDDLAPLAAAGRLGEAVLPLAEVIAATFPRRDVDAAGARIVSHGGRLPESGTGPGPVGVFGPDGSVLALVADTAGVARPLVVFAPL
jgi:tRNA pseudouridine55 synthase